MNAGMTAIQERNRRVQRARELGIDKPHTLKKDALEEAIALAETARDAERAERAADPNQDGEIHDCEHGRMQVYVLDTDGINNPDDTTWGSRWDCPPECKEVPAQKIITEVADALAEREATREAWLLSAVEKLIPLLEQAGASNLRSRRIQVSVSFPSKTIRKRIGECWAAVASGDGEVNHLFVSPLLDDAVEVLGVIAHELIHADDNCESKHNGHFKRVALALGLTGKMTETNVGEDLKPILKDLAEELGTYPHVKLKLGGPGQKKQTTRLIKVHCDDTECPYLENGKGYTIRVTQKWIEVGLPQCPCGALMKVAD